MVERNVLSIINFPFIVRLNYAFQTSQKLFLLLDYAPGGNLEFQLRLRKRFKEEVAKFYICEIILALGELHKHNIIFRDLKPDNIVLDKEGHILLTDFGLSKSGVYDKYDAKSFCGSIAYLAPEMLKRKGHGKAVDWYLLGVVLVKNPDERLGSKLDVEEIKNNVYFKDVEWDKVYNKKYIPPPIIKDVNKIKFFGNNRDYIDYNFNDEPDICFNNEFYNYKNEKENVYINDNIYKGWSFVQNNI